MDAPMTMLANAPTLEDRARRIRRNALRMGEVQGQGYIAQALGVADVLAVSYFHALTYRPEDPYWEGRDRFLLSIGDYAIALYSVLIEAASSRKRNSKPTAPPTAACRCRAWRATRPGWRSAAARLASGSASRSAWALG
jgi:transketolase